MYGVLGIDLMLFCLHGLFERAAWPGKYLAPMCWSLSIGLALLTWRLIGGRRAVSTTGA